MTPFMRWPLRLSVLRGEEPKPSFKPLSLERPLLEVSVRQLAGSFAKVRRVGTTIPRTALLAPLLLLAPLVVALDWLHAAGDMTLFVLAAAALIPLSWLIGEVTDNVAVHVGPGIGGFLNATFGNAPELIIAIIAVSEGLSSDPAHFRKRACELAHAHFEEGPLQGQWLE